MDNLNEYVLEKVKLELHIINSEKRHNLFTNLHGEKGGEILRQIKDIYVNAKTEAKNYSFFTFQFHNLCAGFVRQLPLMLDANDSEKEHFKHIFNFYVHSVFDFYQEKSIEETHERKREHQANENRLDETERGLLSIGGGTIGEIWKVNKKRRNLKSISENQRNLATKLYRMSLDIRMTKTEKEEENLPHSIRERDRGGFFVPKRNFLPFIKAVNECVCEYANDSAYKKYGKNMIKVCVVAVKNRVDICQFFNTAVKAVLPDSDLVVLEEFRQIWIRKIAHARLNEFIRGQFQMLSQQTNSRYKGGQTLRDELFAVTKKKSATAPTVKKRKTGFGISPVETDNLHETSVINNTDGIQKEGKRKRFKSKRLLDFI